MDCEERPEPKQENVFETASWISTAFFWWVKNHLEYVNYTLPPIT
jgi:hypothetical protein